MKKAQRYGIALLFLSLFVSQGFASDWNTLQKKLNFQEKTPADYPDRPSKFIEVPRDELLSSYELDELTFDADPYLEERIPDFLRKILNWSPSPKVTFMASLTPATVSYLERKGVKRFGFLEETHPDEIKTMKYLIVPEDEGFHLYITNLYGIDFYTNFAYRLTGWAKKYGIPEQNISFLYDPAYGFKSQDVMRNSLKDLRYSTDRNQLMMVGYQGAFFYFLRDLQHYLDTFSLEKFLSADFSEFRDWNQTAKKEAEAYLPKELEAGDENFHYIKYNVKFGDTSYEICSFRNMFGDQTRMLLDILLEKGFRTFTIFGNSGGLSDKVELEGLYAPISSTFHGVKAEGQNLAANFFPSVKGLKVVSLFVEDQEWLAQYRGEYDIVDVEQYDVFRAFEDYDDARFYSGLVISDIPGQEQKDKTEVNESSDRMIYSKEQFYFHTLQDILSRRRKK